jgi:hypothetical protein
VGPDIQSNRSHGIAKMLLKQQWKCWQRFPYSRRDYLRGAEAPEMQG